MSTIELLRVEDRFAIQGRGIVLIPDFPVPDHWQNRTEPIVVVMPDGRRFNADAQFNLTHFNLSDRDASLDQRYRVVASIPDRTKEEIPVGSVILASRELRGALLPHEAS